MINFKKVATLNRAGTIKLILSPLDIPLSSVKQGFESGWSIPNSLHAATTTYPLKTAVRASTQALRSS